MDAKQTTLIDLLEAIQSDARLVVEHDQFSSSSHPVGRLCQEAAAELRRLHALNVELVEALQGMIDCCPETRGTHNPYLAMARAALAKAGGSDE